MPGYDVLIYRDFSTTDPLRVGPAAEQFGEGFEGLYVVALGPPIHPTKERTAVLMHRTETTPEIKAMVASLASTEKG